VRVGKADHSECSSFSVKAYSDFPSWVHCPFSETVEREDCNDPGYQYLRTSSGQMNVWNTADGSTLLTITAFESYSGYLTNGRQPLVTRMSLLLVNEIIILGGHLRGGQVALGHFSLENRSEILLLSVVLQLEFAGDFIFSSYCGLEGFLWKGEGRRALKFEPINCAEANCICHRSPLGPTKNSPSFHHGHQFVFRRRTQRHSPPDFSKLPSYGFQ